MVADAFFFDHTVQQNAKHGRPHVDKMDAPGSETRGKDGHQRGRMKGFIAGNPEKSRADKTVQCHVQKRGRVTAHIEKAGTRQRGAGEDFYQTRNHFCPVRHKESGNQKAAAEKQEKESQK